MTISASTASTSTESAVDDEASLATPSSPALAVDHVTQNAINWLVRHQDDAGYWVGQLESNCCMEAEWILSQHVLSIDDDPKFVGVVNAILREQRDDGSWGVYYGAPAGDVSATVECYLALRCAGHQPLDDHMRKARTWIHQRGGLTQVRVFTKMWMALIGEWPWSAVPTMPPELIFLPKWAPFNIYRFSSWARATIVPLTILSARRFVKALPDGRRCDELFPGGRDALDYSLPRRKGWLSWESAFLAVDKLLAIYGRLPWQPFRKKAIASATQWILDHQEADGAWGGIQPPWIYSIMCLHTEGYPKDHPALKAGIDGFNKPWAVEKGDATYLQACVSPVWDTLLSMLALIDCDVAVKDSPAMQRALQWVLDEQVFAGGDWQVYSPDTPAGGWAFEFENETYPDVDDTAVALIVLARLRDQFGEDDPTAQRIDAGIEAAVAWTMGMRSSNGAWGAFDKDNWSKWVARIPFSDFGETLDPPSVDVTAHVVEALGCLGRKLDDPIVAEAVAYIRAEQEPEGSWFGRWGVNHVYGVGAVLPALEAVGEDMTLPYIRKAAHWLVAHQNDDGGWGESPASYMRDDLRGVGDSTASQTGWALMALIATDDQTYRPAVERGLDFLASTQRDDGAWDEPWYTGTGFPGYGIGERVDLNDKANTLAQDVELGRAFMINYNLYRHYFPLMAMGRARRFLASA